MLKDLKVEANPNEWHILSNNNTWNLLLKWDDGVDVETITIF